MQSRISPRSVTHAASGEDASPAERDLLLRARDLDRAALAEVYDRYSPLLYRYAYRLMGDASMAEECVAETFSRLLHALHDGIGPRDHLQAYLFKIAHNWVTDYYRSEATVALADEVRDGASGEPAHVLAQRVESERVRAAMARLPSEQRLVLSLKFVEGWKDADIARSLDLRVSGVKALQRRGLAALQGLLAGERE
ncbi:MAG: RNA polymerase sigma factor [Anaerolineae bacterium]